MAKTTDAIAAYDAAVRKLEELKHDLGELHAREDEMEAAIRERDAQDRTSEAALAFLDGQALEEASNFSTELAEVRRKVPVVERAIGLQRGRIDAAKYARDQALVDAAEPEHLRLVQELAEALVVVGDRADALFASYDHFHEQDVAFSGRLPGLNLAALRSSIPDNRMNRLLDEIERDYGIQMKRAARDHELEQRRAASLRETERKREAGVGIEAGPEGVFEWKGGKRMPVGAR